ncbi:hypothetical protein EIP86_006197 [Pleurotus ostreatoroseus]|nr:hypothetical protein EIP86_006197 [Pleurotus ostreatoroseus]
MVADYVEEGAEPSEEEFMTLRQYLVELAAQAEKDESSLAFQQSCDLHITASDETTNLDAHDLFSSNENASVPYTTTTSYESAGSDGSIQPFSSPLGFLQKAFPHLPVSRLRSALGSSEDVEDVDMEAVVESILAQEFVKELEERGLSDEEAAPSEPWQPVHKAKKAKRKPRHTITLVDVRQQQHARRSASGPSTSHGPPLDPWTQVSSLASRLSDLLGSQCMPYFQSLLHSPQYASPADALREGLALMKPISPLSSAELGVSEQIQLARNIYDMITLDERYADLTASRQDRLMDDVKVSVVAAKTVGQGQEEAAYTALELVFLLQELDEGALDWNVYHSPAPVPTSSFGANGASSSSLGRLTLPPEPASLYSSKLWSPVSPSASKGKAKASPNTWQTVPVTSRGPDMSPHAEYIPAYNPSSRLVKSKKGRKINGVAPVPEKKLDVLEPTWHRHRAGELMERSKEALVQASRAWQRGNAKSRGGEIAFTYAERARELQAQARQENLQAAYDHVYSKSISLPNGNTIDLHGTTVVEAVHIARTMLEQVSATQAKPLKIITGRGNHSVNGVGVLKPAVQAALTSDGWTVSKFDGGLVVRGRISR